MSNTWFEESKSQDGWDQARSQGVNVSSPKAWWLPSTSPSRGCLKQSLARLLVLLSLGPGRGIRLAGAGGHSQQGGPHGEGAEPREKASQKLICCLLWDLCMHVIGVWLVGLPLCGA